MCEWLASGPVRFWTISGLFQDIPGDSIASLIAAPAICTALKKAAPDQSPRELKKRAQYILHGDYLDGRLSEKNPSLQAWEFVMLS